MANTLPGMEVSTRTRINEKLPGVMRDHLKYPKRYKRLAGSSALSVIMGQPSSSVRALILFLRISCERSKETT